VYFQTSNNKGVYFTNDGGNTFSRLNGVSGGNDLILLDNNSFLTVGASGENMYTNDGGISWKNANLSAEINAVGKVFNDSLYVLSNSKVYKIAVSDLDIKTGLADVKVPSPMHIFNSTSTLTIVSNSGAIDRCFIYTISGKLVAISEPKSSSCILNNATFAPGIYIVSALIRGKKYSQKIILK